MLLAQLVETSAHVTATSKRLAKVDLLAALLGQLHPDEIEIGVAFLSGSVRQGKVGVGYSTIRDASPQASEAPSLDLLQVDRAITELAAVSGRGSEGERRERLNSLLGSATRAEQEFLKRLLIGELRQGALEGIMIDAVARAAKLPADTVRRAAMLAGIWRRWPALPWSTARRGWRNTTSSCSVPYSRCWRRLPKMYPRR